mmetsp:Transcript_36673/g.91416  ORF Transcript_36673/g.91416 Transcript_36673/m.91416 type:complete len:184 (-) Transcript_36673:142-693(-)
MGHVSYGALLCVLENCPLLEHLDVSGCTAIAHPSNASVPNVSGDERSPAPPRHAPLVRLNMNRTRISNGGLAHLLKLLPKLEELSLNFCERLDVKSIAQFDANEAEPSVGAIISAHAKEHGVLREVELVGSEAVRRSSVQEMQAAELVVHTDDSFVDSFLQRSPHRAPVVNDLYALICSYHSL